jgi:hypothetical protein
VEEGENGGGEDPERKRVRAAGEKSKHGVKGEMRRGPAEKRGAQPATAS